MKTAEELLQEMKSALAEHEAEAAKHALEATKLRTMIAGAEGRPAAAPADPWKVEVVPLALPPGVKCQAPGLCFCPACQAKALPFLFTPGLPFVPYPPSPPTTPPGYVPVPSPFVQGHGGNCACPACIGITYCGNSAVVLTSPLVVATNEPARIYERFSEALPSLLESSAEFLATAAIH